MRDKNYDRCRRLEARYGDGVMLRAIQMLNDGHTLAETAKTLTNLSVPQFLQYTKTFIGQYFYPTEHALRYYTVKNKTDELETAEDMLNELSGLKKRTNVIHVNFRPSQEESHRA